LVSNSNSKGAMDGRMTDIAKEEGGASGVLARGGAGPNETSGARA
jgi:hypothetical protein